MSKHSKESNSTKTSDFRLRAVLEVLFYGYSGERGFKFFWILYATSYVAFILLFPYFEALSGNNIVLMLVIALALYSIVCQLIRWWRVRDCLKEFEQYAILVVFAVYTSMIFGLVDFAYYSKHLEAYRIDQEILTYEANRATKILRNKLKDTESVVAALDSLEVLILDTVGVPALINYSNDNAGISRYELTLIHHGWKADLNEGLVTTGFGHGVEVRDMNFSHGKMSVHFEPMFHREGMNFDDASNLFAQVSENVRSRSRWATAVRFRKNWEITYVLSPQRERLRHVELIAPKLAFTAFMYQNAMELLGKDPNYYKPMDLFGQTVAFIHAAFKMFYFAVFIVLVSQRLVRSQRSKDQPG